MYLTGTDTYSCKNLKCFTLKSAVGYLWDYNIAAAVRTPGIVVDS